MRIGMVAAAAAMFMAAPASAATFVNLTEIEPNDTLATAQAIPVSLTTSIRLLGTYEGDGANDVDFFSFYVGNENCPPEQPLACNLITAFASAALPNGNGTGADAILSVFNPQGARVSQGDGANGFQARNAAVGTWTFSVRSAAPMTNRAYVLVASLSPFVPEPTSWALMIAGVAAIGAVARRLRPSFAAARPAQGYVTGTLQKWSV